MRDETVQALVQAIRNHPDIVSAAITGSLARPNGADAFSDLDALLIARDVKAVRDIRSWLPPAEQVLLCAWHLSRYCSVLLSDFQKIDLAIFSTDDSPSDWVVQHYQIIKGDDRFESQLAGAAMRSRDHSAAHLNPDVSLDNILLLLATAFARVARGEFLSAQSFLTMAADMLIALERRNRQVDGETDVLDPRRRIERLQPQLAGTLHECLFAPPGSGVVRLAQHVATAYGGLLDPYQLRVLEHLRSGPVEDNSKFFA